MNKPQHPHPFYKSRRDFLKGASTVTATAAGIAFTPYLVEAQLRRRRRDRARKIDLGVRPNPSSPGAVIVRMERLTFITFSAHLHDVNGNTRAGGTAMLTLESCLTWKSRCRGDEEFAAHPLDVNALDACEVYEVQASSWLRSAESVHGGAKSEFKHFVITFLGDNPGVCEGGTHFECLAYDLSADFFPTESFDEMLEVMKSRDKAAQR